MKLKIGLWTVLLLLATCLDGVAQSQETTPIDASDYYRSTLAAAEKSLRLNETREARGWLDQSPMAYRGWEWRHLDSRCDEAIEKTTLEDSGLTSIDVSPDWNLVVIADTNGIVKLLNAVNLSEVRQLGDHQNAVYSVSFSPDSNRIVTVSRDITSRVWDVVTGKQIAQLKLDNEGVAAACFSPDGGRVATCTWRWVGDGDSRCVEGVIWIWNATTGERVATMAGHEGFVNEVRFSNDSQRLITASVDGTLCTWDVATGRMLDTLRGHTGSVTACAVSPKNGRLISASRDQTIRAWDLEAGQQLGIFHGHTNTFSEVCFSPDGQWIATAANGDPARIWNVSSGECVAELGNQQNVAATVAWSPDGKLIATGRTGSISFWSPQSFQLQQSIACGDSSVYQLAFSPDSSRLAVGSNGIWILDPRESVALLRIQPNDDENYFLAFSPDGGRLASWTTGGQIAFSESQTLKIRTQTPNSESKLP